MFTHISMYLSVIFHSDYDNFLGVEVVGEVELVVTNEGMNFLWKDRSHGKATNASDVNSR